MPTIYIAFIECVLRPYGHWKRTMDRPDFSPNIADQYIPTGKDAELALVDIKQNRRYFRFTDHQTVVRIFNNTVTFEDEDVEEFAVDESKQFPKKPDMGN